MAHKEPMRGKLKTAPVDAPEYLVTKTSLIEGRQVNAGSTVRYAGIPGAYLRPMDGKGKAVVEKVKAILKGTGVEGIDKLQGDDRTKAIEAAMREYADELLNVPSIERGVTDVDLRAVGIDPAISDSERAPLLAAAEQTRKDTLENSQDRGGVLVQLTGEQPSTVIPTTGPLAQASPDEIKATTEKLAGKK